MPTKMIPDRFFEVTYLVVETSLTQGTRAGGSGSTRLWLSDLPTWLAERPGTLIVSMREVV